MSDIIITSSGEGEREFTVTDVDTEEATTYPSKAEAMKASRHAAKGGGTVVDASITRDDTGAHVPPEEQP